MCTDHVRFFLVFITILVDIFQNCNALKCFECSNVPLPRDCANVRICGAHEYCLVEQYVTSDGFVKYNSGCMDQPRCPDTRASIIGRSAYDVKDKRSTNIETCRECCNMDFCNNKGCGAIDVDRSMRGPYCFSCHSTSDPKICNEVSVCPINSVCSLQTPLDLAGLPDVLYRGQCQTKASCDAVATTNRNSDCPVYCCDQDFCNDHCGTYSNISMTTSKAVVTTVATTQSSLCRAGHYYDEITGMCIKLFESVELTYADAKSACERIGDMLAAPDTHEKTVFVEYVISHHSMFNLPSKRKFWIGAFDTHNDSAFDWPNGQGLTYTNWGRGDATYSELQPDDPFTKNEDCVYINGRDKYRWFDGHCWETKNYICEDPRSLKSHTHSSTENSCKNGHYYDDNTGMCITIGELQKVNRDEAKRACYNIGDTLVIIDSHEKTIFVENVLLHNSTISDIDDKKYYTALRINHGGFRWPHEKHDAQYTNWGGGDEIVHRKQPDGHGKESCVMLNGKDHYKWHDIRCNDHIYYICEDRHSLKQK